MIRDLLTPRDDSDNPLGCMSNTVIAVAPPNPGTTEKAQAEKEEFLSLHLSLFRLLRDGSMPSMEAVRAADLTEGLLRLL